MRKRYVSNEPSRNPFAAPDPNRPTPPPEQHRPQEAGKSEPGQSEHGQGGPGGSGNPNSPKPPKEDPKPPSLEELKAASGATFRFGALLILSLLSTQLPLPYTLAAPVLIIISIVYGIRALRRSWAISPRNLMTPMLIAGIAMALMMSVTVASKFALWPIEMERQECVQYAITNSAEAECEANYQKAVEERLTSLRNLAPTSS